MDEIDRGPQMGRNHGGGSLIREAQPYNTAIAIRCGGCFFLSGIEILHSLVPSDLVPSDLWLVES
jgi:hypothetical protein